MADKSKEEIKRLVMEAVAAELKARAAASSKSGPNAQMARQISKAGVESAKRPVKQEAKSSKPVAQEKGLRDFRIGPKGPETVPVAGFPGITDRGRKDSNPLEQMASLPGMGISALQEDAPYVAREIMGGNLSLNPYEVLRERVTGEAPTPLKEQLGPAGRLLTTRATQSLSPFLQTQAADDAIEGMPETRAGVEGLEDIEVPVLGKIGPVGAGALQFISQAGPGMGLEMVAGLNAASKGSTLIQKMIAAAKESGAVGGMTNAFTAPEGERTGAAMEGAALGSLMGSAGGVIGNLPKKPKPLVDNTYNDGLGPRADEAPDLKDPFDFGMGQVEDIRAGQDKMVNMNRDWVPGDTDFGVLSPKQAAQKRAYFEKETYLDPDSLRTGDVFLEDVLKTIMDKSGSARSETVNMAKTVLPEKQVTQGPAKTVTDTMRQELMQAQDANGQLRQEKVIPVLRAQVTKLRKENAKLKGNVTGGGLDVSRGERKRQYATIKRSFLEKIEDNSQRVRELEYRLYNHVLEDLADQDLPGNIKVRYAWTMKEGTPVNRGGGEYDLQQDRPHGTYLMPGLKMNPAFSGANVLHAGEFKGKNPLVVTNMRIEAGSDPMKMDTTGPMAAKKLMDPIEFAKWNKAPLEELKAHAAKLAGLSEFPRDAAWQGAGPAWEMIGASLAKKAGYDSIVMYAPTDQSQVPNKQGQAQALFQWELRRITEQWQALRQKLHADPKSRPSDHRRADRLHDALVKELKRNYELKNEKAVVELAPAEVVALGPDVVRSVDREVRKTVEVERIDDAMNGKDPEIVGYIDNLKNKLRYFQSVQALTLDDANRASAKLEADRLSKELSYFGDDPANEVIPPAARTTLPEATIDNAVRLGQKTKTFAETSFDHNKRGLDGPGASSKGDITIQETLAKLEDKLANGAPLKNDVKVETLDTAAKIAENKKRIAEIQAQLKAQPKKKLTKAEAKIAANAVKIAQIEAALAAGKVDPGNNVEAKAVVENKLDEAKVLDDSVPPTPPPPPGMGGSPTGAPPTPPVSPPSSLIDLHEHFRNIANNTVNPSFFSRLDKVFRKQEFRSPEEEAEAIKNVKSMHVVENMRANQLIPRLRAAYRKAGPEGQKLLRHYFQQQDDPSLTKKFRKINFEELPSEFRQLTETSEKYVTGMIDDLKANGYLDPAMEATMQKMKEDGRKWFHRSYFAFIEPSFKYEKDLYSKAIIWLSTEAKTPMTEPEAIKFLHQLRNGDPARSMDQRWSEAVAKVDVLKHKQNLPPIIRELLGQIHDPTFVVASSHAEVERLWHHMRATQAMTAPEGKGKVWNDTLSEGMWPDPIPNSKKLYGEFAGKYVPPQLYEALIDGNGANIDAAIPLLGGVFSKLFKTGAIALNHSAYISQAISNLAFLAAAGLPSWNAKLAPALFNAARSVVDFYGKPFRVENGRGKYMQMAIEDGAIIPGTGADFGGAAMANYARNLLSMEKKGLAGFIEAPIRGARHALGKLGNAYDLLDHVPRLAAYTYQLEKGLKRGLNMKTARARASMIVQRNFASAGNSTDAVKKLFKTHGYVNEFGAFWVDNIRVQADMLMDSTNWKGLGSPFGGEGLARTYNVFMQRMMFTALATFLVKKYAFSDDEMETAEKSLRTGFKAYNPTRSWLPFRDSQGRMVAVSWSNADPMASFLKGNPDDSLLSRMSVNMATGWMGNSMGDLTRHGIAANLGVGTSPYRPDPITGEAQIKLKELLWGTFAPRSITKVQEAYRKYANEKYEMGRYEMPLTGSQAVWNAIMPTPVEPVGYQSNKGNKKALRGEIKNNQQDLRAAKRKYSPEERQQIKEAVKAEIKRLKTNRKEMGK